MPDLVNHPPHYTVGGIEVLDIIESWQLDFCSGNVIKYLLRAPHKGDPLTDLQKARFYLDRLIARHEARQPKETPCETDPPATDADPILLGGNGAT